MAEMDQSERVYTRPKPFAFVLMPFAPQFDDIYRLGIKDACARAGAYCERVDEQIYQGTILARIYQQIAVADIVIADMTGRNPNVFYEVGYAHALDKRVLLLTQDVNDIPFDLSNYPHIVYGKDIGHLTDDLETTTRWIINNLSDSAAYLKCPLRCFVNNEPLATSPTVGWSPQSINFRAKTLQISIHNDPVSVIQRVSFQCSLQSPSHYSRAKVSSRPGREAYEVISCVGHKATAIHQVDQEFSLRPGAWDVLYYALYLDDERSTGALEPFSFTVLTEGHPLEFPFMVTTNHLTKS
jgi:hypothetical protein